MTWLFTQVWLWSLAAFVLGSLITWLLFVRPVKRQLRSLMAEYAEYAEYAEQQLNEAPLGYDDPTEVAEPERTAALDLLDPPPAWDQHDARSDEITFGGWDRTPLAWTAPTPSTPDQSDSYHAEHVEPQVAPTHEVSATDTDPATFAHTNPSTPAVQASDRVVHEPELQVRREPTQPAKPPAVLPEMDLVDTEIADQSPADSSATASERSSWFQKVNVAEQPGSREWSGTLEGSSAEEQEPQQEEDLSGRLRSLFEPVSTVHVEQGQENTPYVPPLGSEATQSIPRVDDPDDADQPLPRRTPGAGPKPGAQNLNGWARREPESADEHRRGGNMIKGHFASRQYHTPDSPDYERIVAEVWFRTPEDAEEAGFEPWDGHTRN